MHKTEMITLGDLISASYNYRKFIYVWHFNNVENHLKQI